MTNLQNIRHLHGAGEEFVLLKITLFPLSKR